MGSKSNTKNIVGIAVQRSTGTAFAGNGPEVAEVASITQDRDQRFVIRLVNIDLTAVASLVKGQDVYVGLSSDPIHVSTLEGRRIGDVSAADTERVRSHGSSGGVVVDFSVDSPTYVAVRLG